MAPRRAADVIPGPDRRVAVRPRRRLATIRHPGSIVLKYRRRPGAINPVPLLSYILTTMILLCAADRTRTTEI